MSVNIGEAFALCLEMLEDQETTLEDCLNRFPQHQAELIELLGMVKDIQSLPTPHPRAAFDKRAGRRLVPKLPDRVQAKPVRYRLFRPKQKPILTRRFRKAYFVVALVLFLTITIGGMGFAADFAAPGDPLYALDLWIERLQLNLASDVESLTAIHLNHANERLKEAQQKLAEDDLENGQAALDAYGNEIATLAQLLQGSEGLDRDALTTLINSATSKHQEVLTELLAKVPEPAQVGIQKALEASAKMLDHQPDLPEGTGPPQDLPADPPVDPGSPDNLPGDPPKGPPDDAGPPEDPPKGPPDDAGPPKDPPKGPPDDAGPPKDPPGNPPVDPGPPDKP
jgi:hypothetical protein